MTEREMLIEALRSEALHPGGRQPLVWDAYDDRPPTEEELGELADRLLATMAGLSPMRGHLVPPSQPKP